MRLRPAVVLLALLVAAAGCARSDAFSPIPDPGPVKAGGDTTTTIADTSGVALPGAQGTTTTAPIVLGPGSARIDGRVDGPDGPVAGATVRVERLVGSTAVGVQVPTAADGTWNVPNILGGRYRVRAWQPPALAMATPQVFWLDGGATHALVLRVDSFGGTTIDTVIAPNPPMVDGPSNLLLRVSTRMVRPDGVVARTPVAGVGVTLNGSGEWDGLGATGTTGGDGSIVFQIVCRASGPQPLVAALADGTTVGLPVPDCFSPPPPTTSTSSTSSTTTTTR